MNKTLAALVAAVALAFTLGACSPTPAPVSAPVAPVAPVATTDADITAALVYCVRTPTAKMPTAEWVTYCTPVHDAVNVVMSK